MCVHHSTLIEVVCETVFSIFSYKTIDSNTILIIFSLYYL